MALKAARPEGRRARRHRPGRQGRAVRGPAQGRRRDRRPSTARRSPTPTAVRDAVGAHKPGETVALGLVRDGKPVTVAAKTRDADGRATVGVFLGIRFEFPFDVKINAGDVGGPSAGTMFSLGGLRHAHARPAHRRSADRRHRHDRLSRQGRPDRRHPPEARRRPRRRREVVPRARRQLRRGRRPRPRRAAGGQDRDLRRGQDRGRGDRRQARRLAAHLHEVAAARLQPAVCRAGRLSPAASP